VPHRNAVLIALSKKLTPAQPELVTARGGFRRPGRRELTVSDIAEQLMTDRVVASLISYCTMPEGQALGAVAWLAQRRHGPLSLECWNEPTRSVPRAEVVDLLGGSADGLRDAADVTLDRLAQLGLVLPAPRHGDVVVADYIHHTLAAEAGLGRPAMDLIRADFNAPEVHRLAECLGLGKAAHRADAERDIETILADPIRVRKLLDSAPIDARQLAEEVSKSSTPWIRATCFQRTGGYHPNAKYSLSPHGSGSPAADWLAARGLLLPAGEGDLLELVLEVKLAVEGELRAPFTAQPPPWPELPVVGDVAKPAAAAAATAVWQMERLLAACGEQPAALRKAGGIAVRDTKRLARAIGVDEEITRFWLTVAVAAGLLGQLAEPVEKPKGYRGKAIEPNLVVLPTEDYDRWLTLPPDERLAHVVAAWATLPTICLLPDPDSPPIALLADFDNNAVSLRYAMLEALATLPEGRGIDGSAMPHLVEAAIWQRPFRVGGDDGGIMKIEATLREAELLSAAALGAATSVGRVVAELLGTGNAWKTAVSTLTPVLAELFPPPHTTARFQADLTAMVAGAPSRDLFELLNAVGDRESEGHAVVWRLSAASVRRALDAGHTADGLIEQLTAVARGGRLPQPVEYLIKDVGRTHGHVRVVRSSCCLRSDDETLLTELMKAAALRKLGLRRIAPTVLISTSSDRETLDALRAAGYSPALEAETGVTVLERSGIRRAPSRPTR